jgi:rubrerythrin
MQGERVERLRRNHRDEIDSAALYAAMASAERDQRLADVYRELAAAERRHAARWAVQLEQLGADRPSERPSRRARSLAWLARRFGASLLVPTLAALLESSREFYAHQIDVERREIATMPELETKELAPIYRAKGLAAGEAHALAERIMSDEETALDAMAREELGIDPDHRGGSAAVAAVASFVPFTPRAPPGCSSWARRSPCSPTAASSAPGRGSS